MLKSLVDCLKTALFYHNCLNMHYKELLMLRKNGLKKAVALLTNQCALTRPLNMGINAEPLFHGCHLEK